MRTSLKEIKALGVAKKNAAPARAYSQAATQRAKPGSLRQQLERKVEGELLDFAEKDLGRGDLAEGVQVALDRYVFFNYAMQRGCWIGFSRATLNEIELPIKYTVATVAPERHHYFVAGSTRDACINVLHAYSATYYPGLRLDIKEVSEHIADISGLDLPENHESNYDTVPIKGYHQTFFGDPLEGDKPQARFAAA